MSAGEGRALQGRPLGGVAPNNLVAMLWAFAGASSSALMGATMKAVASDLPIAAIIFWRMLFTFIPLLPWLVREGPRAALTRRLGEHFLRALWGTGALGLLIFALGRLTLADTIALGFTRPLWMTVFAAIFLGEVVRMRRGIATAVGFAGVVIMVRPQGGVDPAMLAALGVALCGVATMIHVKRLAATEPAARIVFYYAFFGFLLSVPFAIPFWTVPSLPQTGWIGLSACALASSLYCQSRACRVGDATIVAPLDYCQLPIAALIGFFAFSELPSLWALLGALLIAGSTLYIARREAYLRRLKGTRT